MDYFWLILLVTALAGTHLALVGRYNGLLTLDTWFVASQWVMAVGALALLDPRLDVESEYALVVSVPLAIYVFASIAVHFHLSSADKKFYPGFTRVVLATKPTLGVWALLALSALISIAYYQAVGYNTFLLGLRDIATGTTADYTTLRLESYGQSRYLFPGYVNQFKNIILPALTLVVFTALRRNGSRSAWPFLAAFGTLSFVSLLGTGQRGAFIQFSLVLLTYMFLLNRKKFPKRALRMAIAVLPPIFFTTALLGRSGATDEGVGARIRVLAGELMGRIFRDNQFSGIAGFYYTHRLPTQDGAEWVAASMGVLPGNSGSPLAREVFYSLYGTMRGTAPVSLWGSIHYNFGWVGLIVLPMVLAFAYQNISRRGIRKSPVSTLELIGMAGTFVVLGNWVAGGPDYVLNSGGITYPALWWMGRILAAKQVEPSKSARREPSAASATDSRATAVPGARTTES